MVNKVQENGINFYADTLHGQKAGFFLDQRDARASGKASKNRRPQSFSYSGAYSVYAAKNGATQVTSIDISKPALQQAKNNFTLNGFGQTTRKKYAFEDHDVFDIVGGRNFLTDHMILLFVILQPLRRPKLMCKTHQKPTSCSIHCFHICKGGILVTSSCSVALLRRRFEIFSVSPPVAPAKRSSC